MNITTMYERFLRYQDAAPSECGGLLPMDHDQYNAWSENARLARIEYVAGKLTSEEFLRRIDTTHVLTSYEAGKAGILFAGESSHSTFQQKQLRPFFMAEAVF